jgi:hypothetical protein
MTLFAQALPIVEQLYETLIEMPFYMLLLIFFALVAFGLFLVCEALFIKNAAKMT